MIASEKEIIRRKPQKYVFYVKTKAQLEAALTLADYVIVSEKLFRAHDKIWLAPSRFCPVETALPAGFHDLYCQNVGHIALGKGRAELHGGFGLNVVNNAAAEFLAGSA
jgi:hypothetical protein